MLALCSAGLEQAPCIELKRMGYKVLKVTSGHIYFSADLPDIPKLNTQLYSVDRLLIKFDNFEALTFDELFDGTYSLPWETIVHRDAHIVVEKVKIRSSKLSATGAVASVVKKAIYERIKSTKKALIAYPLYIYVKNNLVELALDTTGKDALNKRGYRIKTSVAPLRETIASALILISGWDTKKLLIDPFCGSGTIPIEAARMSLGMPNKDRSFAFQSWPIFAGMGISNLNEQDGSQKIIARGFDIDGSILKVAIENAMRAGVHNHVRFEKKDFFKLKVFDSPVHVVTNPPYGLRTSEIDSEFYRKLTRLFKLFPDSRICLITPKENFEKLVGKEPQKKFRFQNSGLWTWCYIFG